MNQKAFTFDQPRKPSPPPADLPKARAPSNGTPTSNEAAASIEPVAGFLNRQVLEFIRSRGSHGATCDEVEVALELAHQTASARMWDLKDPTGNRPLIRAVPDVKRKTRSGRGAQVFVATEVAQ